MRDHMKDNSEAQTAKGKEISHGRPHWRFEDLEIWNKAADLAVKFHRIAERLDRRRLYRYAEQLRAAGLSISNNIAEGSGSVHKQEFIQFLNITRRSLFEDASMLLVFERLGLLESTEVDDCFGTVTKKAVKSPAYPANSDADALARFALPSLRLPVDDRHRPIGYRSRWKACSPFIAFSLTNRGWSIIQVRSRLRSLRIATTPPSEPRNSQCRLV
jgi:four helix bundle protein